MKGKVLFIDKAHPILPEKLEAIGLKCIFQTDASRETLENIVNEFVGIVVRSRIKVDKPFLQKAKNVQFIARYGVGLEHIDLAYAEKRGIAVFNSPEGSKDTVGEHTLGLFLNMMNHISRANTQVKSGQWLREPNRGLEIKGKTVGIIGCGNLGYAFAKRLAGFEARVVAYDKYKSGFSDQYVEEVDFHTFLKVVDLVSLHIPYTPDNHYFFNSTLIEQFKKPFYLVNTARGLVLNTADLVAALKAGKVLGAALDVIEYEERSFVHLDLDELPEAFQYLRQSEKVLLTPHIAGWSHEAKQRHAEVLAEKINLFIQSDL